jgi:hypothetical protein
MATWFFENLFFVLRRFQWNEITVFDELSLRYLLALREVFLKFRAQRGLKAQRMNRKFH